VALQLCGTGGSDKRSLKPGAADESVSENSNDSATSLADFDFGVDRRMLRRRWSMLPNDAPVAAKTDGIATIYLDVSGDAILGSSLVSWCICAADHCCRCLQTIASPQSREMTGNYIDVAAAASPLHTSNNDAPGISRSFSTDDFRKISYQVSEVKCDWARFVSTPITSQEFKFIAPKAPLGRGAFGVV
jgi:hypothetical protein